MALIHCPECGWEVSSKAKVCPKCGYPLQIGKSAPLGTGITKLRFFKRVFVIVLIFVVLLILTPIILSVSKKASFTFSPEDLQQSVETINIVDYPITINGIEVVNVLNSISLNAFSQTGNTNDYTIYSSSLENCIINLVYDGNGNVVLYNTHLIAGSDGEAERNLSADFYAFAGYMKMINKNASPYEICNTYAEIKNSDYTFETESGHEVHTKTIDSVTYDSVETPLLSWHDFYIYNSDVDINELLNAVGGINWIINYYE